MSDMKTLLENFTRFTEGRFTGGSIDIEPLSGEEQDASTEAYYELYEFLLDSTLPGDKPSDKLQYALRWIAKFEQGENIDPWGEVEPEEEEEVEPLRLSAPTEDPWKFKKRLGIGGSVHDRLGGPRHREKK